MKLNILILFLIISIKTGSILGPYSIQVFIKEVKKNGLFEIIQSIKDTYGQDVAIISCEELKKKNNGNCKKLVTDYMENTDRPNSTQTPGPKLNLICTKGLILSPYIKQSNLNSAIKRILKRNFNENQTNLIFIKIIKRFCKK